ncbi:MAG: 3D-(3,5/4)-trihydroxycyclohexane-1,2-dione acylhydrolase (decyclizing) [Rhodobacteraceae bacterium]|nr:3D-(3,5/4)-trihydroxycyclohexane-1,2-dione acylhydrolase (decyclizing) [Paracoccaceae bacterium]
MNRTVRLTAAQAMVRYISAQLIEGSSATCEAAGQRGSQTFIAGVWAIFGHGNVAGLGEALYALRDTLPTYRGHNEQTMAHAAIAYSKQRCRKRTMMVTSSIGPGATNMVTAAALAHVNRLPVLLVPGDVFANRGPDPVLQQIEDFGDGTVSVNDAFKPVSRYFDRIIRPEQLLTALPRAFRTLTDPADCGPVTLAFCQDVQAEAYDYPVGFFKPTVWHNRRVRPDTGELGRVADVLKAAKRPVIVAGGGVHYAEATDTLKMFAEARNIPVAETQAGKSALPWDHSLNLGPIGVTGGEPANDVCAKADFVLGVGTRFQDFTTGSRGLFANPDRRIISLNVAAYDAAKHGAIPLMADAREGLEELDAALGETTFQIDTEALKAKWFGKVNPLTDAPEGNALPTDMQVIGAVQRAANKNTVAMCAAGTMPGELHKLWKAGRPGSYHMEYGFSCMGYEIAGAMGIKMAAPELDVICFTGDGTYMMANSEMATAAMMGLCFTVVVTDNRGFGCINRLQMATGGAEFNNLLDHTLHETPSAIDFAAHAAAMGAASIKVSSIAELEEALARRSEVRGPYVIVIDTDPYASTAYGGTWWEVGVPEISDRTEVKTAYKRHVDNKKTQRAD